MTRSRSASRSRSHDAGARGHDAAGPGRGPGAGPGLRLGLGPAQGRRVLGAGRRAALAAHVRRHSAQHEPVPRHRLPEDAPAEPAGARHDGRGVAAGRLVAAAAQRSLPRGHAALPVLALQPRVSGPRHLPVPLSVRRGSRRLRGPHERVRLPLARHVPMRQIPRRQRHVHRAAVRPRYVTATGKCNIRRSLFSSSVSAICNLLEYVLFSILIYFCH